LVKEFTKIGEEEKPRLWMALEERKKRWAARQRSRAHLGKVKCRFYTFDWASFSLAVSFLWTLLIGCLPRIMV
jgi:hypothetical protein